MRLPLWEFAYSRETEFGYTYDPLDAKLVSIVREKRHEEATIRLLRSQFNEYLVETLPIVVVFYNGDYVWAGKLLSYTRTRTYITAVLYNGAFESCKGKTITGNYANTSAANVLAAVCEAAGINFDGGPTQEVSVRFDDADCWNAVLFLADATGAEPYGYTYETGEVYLGLQLPNENWHWLQNAKPKSIGQDFTQYRSKVRVRGVDQNGLKIVGEAGEGDRVAVFTEKKATDQATLEAIAQKKLEELQETLSTIPLTCPMLATDEPWEIQPGYMVGFGSNIFRWGGYYVCQKLMIYPTKVDFELVKPKKTLDQIVADLKKYADLGIYGIEPSQLTPMALNLSGLVGLYHLTDGTTDPSTTKAKDSSEANNDGTITNGFWVNGIVPGSKVLAFDAMGYIHVGDELDPGGKSAFAVAAWFSPEESYGDGNYLIIKVDQFFLQHYGEDNRLRFGVYIENTWRTVTSDAEACPLWSRNFAVGVYDGVNLSLYLNGVLLKSVPQTGNVDLCGNDVFLASSYEGVIAEVSLWARALSAQEVSELYFFPLTRVVKKSALPPYPYPLKALGIKVIDLNEDFQKTGLQFKVIDVSGL